MKSSSDNPNIRSAAPRPLIWTAWLSVLAGVASILYILYETRNGGGPGIGSAIIVGSTMLGLSIIQIIMITILIFKASWRQNIEAKIVVLFMSPLFIIIILYTLMNAL